jgi:hypothetical protein
MKAYVGQGCSCQECKNDSCTAKTETHRRFRRGNKSALKAGKYELAVNVGNKLVSPRLGFTNHECKVLS